MQARKAAVVATNSTVHKEREIERRRSGPTAPRRHPRERVRFFTVAEVAGDLGVSTRTIRRLIQNLELVKDRAQRAKLAPAAMAALRQLQARVGEGQCPQR